MSKKTANTKLSLLHVVLQLAVIVVCVYVGFKLSRSFQIIPYSVLPLPPVYISPNDVFEIIGIFCVCHLGFYLFSTWIYRTPALKDRARFAGEYMFYLLGYTTASLYLFLATTINYDAQMVAAIGVLATVGLVILFAVNAVVTSGSIVKFVSSLFLAPWAIVKRLFSISGLLVMLFFISPLILGVAFVADRDTANVITQIRIFFNQEDSTDWGLVNALGDVVFAQPILVKLNPDQQDELLVLERNGVLKRVDYPSGNNVEVVLDITQKLGDVESENGALGFAFHPEFGQAGSSNASFIYMYYTNHREDGQTNYLSRFDLSKNTASEVLSTEQHLLVMHRESSGFHNGGSVEFGPDGFLYVGLGEGVRQPELFTYADVLRAGIIRIDVNSNSEIAPSKLKNGTATNYTIPADNPFVGDNTVFDEYWAIGLRNPFRFSHDPKTGQLWAGDVGSTVWEEVNLIEKGTNYQFPAVEGRVEIGANELSEEDQHWIASLPDNLPQQGPVYTYEHTAYDRAVIGGVIYRDGPYEELEGKYIFADNYSAKVFLLETGQATVDSVALMATADQFAQRGVSSVMQLSNGDVLVTTLGAASSPGGEVLRLVRANEAAVVNAKKPAKIDNSDNVDEALLVYNTDVMKSLFVVNCARCHGIKGDAQGPDSGKLGVPVPDLTSAEFHETRSEQQLYDVIYKGGTAVGLSPMMPPWGGFLKDQEIDFMVRYIQELKQE